MTQLHWLWGQAAGKEGYEKRRWVELQREIERLESVCKLAHSAIVALQDNQDGSLISPARTRLEVLIAEREVG